MNEQSIIVATQESMHKYFMRKRPRSILVLFKGEAQYIRGCKQFLWEKKISSRWEAIAFSTPPRDLFEQVYDVSVLERLEELPTYDLILIACVLEDWEKNEVISLIDRLLKHTIMNLCVLEVIQDGEECHERLSPLMFNHFNYKFSTFHNEYGMVNFHMFATMPTHPKLPLDEIKNLGECKKVFKLAYWLPHEELTGGLKTFLEQMRQMTRRGHQVIVYRRGKPGEKVFPSWCDLDETVDVTRAVLVTNNESIESCIEPDTDIVMLTALIQLEGIHDFTRPIILWEKGYCNLFGEFVNEEFNYLLGLQKLRQIYSLPIHIFSVSPTIQDIFEYRYGRKTLVLSNGIDTNFYHPCHFKMNFLSSKLTILLIGNPHLRFKGFERAFRILDRLYENHVSFQVQWIGQEAIRLPDKPYTIHAIVKPTQEELAKYYREADVLLSTSVYEGFSMPPLEAMASGISVVATNNGGIMSYAKDGENALVCEQGDEEALYEALYKVATDAKLRKTLGKKGRETALALDYAKVAQRLEQLLYSVYCYWHKDEE